MPRLVASFFLGLAVLSSGCNYRFGGASEPPFSSLVIEAIRNDSYAPQLQAELHRQLADRLSQEHSIHVVSSGGQARLDVTIVDYRRDVAAVNPADTLSAASYTLTLSAKATLTDTRSGKVLFKDRRFNATLPAYTQTGFNRTESQTIPLLSRELAKRIDEAIVGVW